MTAQPSSLKSSRLVVVLAGGEGRRMGGRDKGAVLLNGAPLIAHVMSRLASQADEVMICAAHDYGLGATHIPDRPDGPLGPAAGLWAAQCWLRDHRPDAVGFYTAPVDAPLVSDCLVEKLYHPEKSTVAATGGRLHPTFAYWRCADLGPVLHDLSGTGPSLRHIAARVGALSIDFDDEGAFYNINTQQDLQKAQEILCGD